jgi:hypothetical protein
MEGHFGYGTFWIWYMKNERGYASHQATTCHKNKISSLASIEKGRKTKREKKDMKS